jgi:hypothetical protein
VPHIFYLNMQNLGGAAEHRNHFFALAMLRVRNDLMDPVRNGNLRPRFAVAAFAEVLNARAAPVVLPWIAWGLFNPNPTGFVETFIGETAFHRREYIGIAWDNNLLNVEHAGLVLPDGRNAGRWVAEDTPANQIPLPPVIEPLDGDWDLDQRGMAYIAARDRVNQGQPRIFAFAHNQLAVGNIVALLAGLNEIERRIRGAIGGDYRNAAFFIGADWNVPPMELADREHRGDLRPLAAEENGAWINTTNVNPFDWWYVSDGDIDPARCRVWPQTRAPNPRPPGWPGSDHAGISLFYN